MTMPSFSELSRLPMPEIKRVATNLGPLSMMYTYSERSKTKDVVNVYGYCRVSTVRQRKDGSSIEDQVKQIQDRCMGDVRRRLVEIYIDDGISGAKDQEQRPGLKRLLRETTAGDIVMITDVSRFARNTRMALNLFQDYFVTKKVTLQIFALPLDMGSAIGQMMFTMMLSIAEQQRVSSNQRISQVMQTMKALGRLRKRPPYGKKINPEGEGYIDHPEEKKGIDVIVAEIKKNPKVKVAEIIRVLSLSEHKDIPIRGKNKKWYPGTIQRIIRQNNLRPTPPPKIIKKKSQPLNDEAGLMAQIIMLRAKDPDMSVGTITSHLQKNYPETKDKIYAKRIEELMRTHGLSVYKKDPDDDAKAVECIRELLLEDKLMKYSEITRRMNELLPPPGRAPAWYDKKISRLIEKYKLR